MHRFFGTASWLLGAAVCLAFAPHASAQLDDWDDDYYPFAREGLYVGVGALFALENFDRGAAIGGAALGISAEDGGGFELRGGSRVYPNFAGELLFQFHGGFSVKDRTSGSKDSFNGWSLTGNAKGYPLLGRVQPYGVAGVGLLSFTQKRDADLGFVARIGGGVDLYLSEAVVVDLEIVYLLPAGSLDDYQFTTFTVGIQYRY